jgi:hypothetical protein
MYGAEISERRKKEGKKERVLNRQARECKLVFFPTDSTLRRIYNPQSSPPRARVEERFAMWLRVKGCKD